MGQKAIRRWYMVHKWTSLVCTLFLLLLCISGLPLIFRDEIAALEQNTAAAVLPEGTPDAPLDEVVATARALYPKESVQFAFWDDDRPHTVVVALTPDFKQPDASHRVALDARTAKVLDEPGPDRGFMHFMLELHIELFAGLPGELFLGVMGLLFTASLVSGVVVYGPFMRKLDFGTVRLDRSRRLKWLDLHNLLGIVTLTWTAVVGFTGVMNTVSSPLFLLYQSRVLPALLEPYKGKPLPGHFSPVQAAVDEARRALPGQEITTVSFPGNPFGSPRHYLVWAHGSTILTSEMYTPVLVDAESGQVVRAQGLPWYLRAIEVSRPLHFGNYGGMPLKIIWALLDLVTIVVLGSGLYLWLVRRRSALDTRVAAYERGDVQLPQEQP
jgi:uncharacterized iron-regulated membrane protein